MAGATAGDGPGLGSMHERPGRIAPAAMALACGDGTGPPLDSPVLPAPCLQDTGLGIFTLSGSTWTCAE